MPIDINNATGALVETGVLGIMVVILLFVSGALLVYIAKLHKSHNEKIEQLSKERNEPTEQALEKYIEFASTFMSNNTRTTVAAENTSRALMAIDMKLGAKS